MIHSTNNHNHTVLAPSQPPSGLPMNHDQTVLSPSQPPSAINTNHNQTVLVTGRRIAGRAAGTISLTVFPALG